MLNRLLSALVLSLCVSQTSHGDVLDEIWSAWEAQEDRCGALRMEYTSQVIRTMEDTRSKQSMRTTAQGVSNVHFALGGRMLAQTVLEEVASTEGQLGKGTTLELACDDLDLLYFQGMNAILTQRTDGRQRPNEVGVLYQLMRPTAAAVKAAYRIEPKADVEGHPCVVLSRSHEHSKEWRTTFTLYLREDLGFLPVKIAQETWTVAGLESSMTSRIAYDLVDGVHMPMDWTIDQVHGIDTAAAVKVRTTALRKSVQLNVELPRDIFQVELAAGTRLRDLRGVAPTKEVLTEPRTLGAATVH